jgi:hypothetical protein
MQFGMRLRYLIFGYISDGLSHKQAYAVFL